MCDNSKEEREKIISFNDVECDYVYIYIDILYIYYI